MKADQRKNTFIHRRTAYTLGLGALVFAAQPACSDSPTQQPAGTVFSAAGTGNTSAGTGNTGGTPGAAGTFGTAGSETTVAGTSFGNAGTEAGGTGTGGSGGAGGTSAGTAGTGGTPIVVVPPYCEGKTEATLPYDISSAFYASAWQGDFTQIAVIPEDDLGDEDPCAARVPNAVGGCSRWRYTPNAATPTWAAVAWVNRADANYTHDPVCLADGATRISFFARGMKGGEVISVGGGGANEVQITLTTEWREYEVPLEGVVYNPPEGVPSGFSWKVDPPAEDPEIVEFFIDNLQFVSTPLVGNEPGGGEGGAGGAGGAAN